jgi:hypothetical protein
MRPLKRDQINRREWIAIAKMVLSIVDRLGRAGTAGALT